LAMAPLYVYEKKNGGYSEEVAQMYLANSTISQAGGGRPCWPN